MGTHQSRPEIVPGVPGGAGGGFVGFVPGVVVRVFVTVMVAAPPPPPLGQQ